jgi:hypothetical protein
MATLSDLVSVLARVTGLPEATVFAYGRFAREAGLVSQGGRGRGGAQMTATDATNLLLALCGTRVTREAGKAIVALRPLAGEIGAAYNKPPLQLTEWLDRYSLFAMAQTGNSLLLLGTFVDYIVTEASNGQFEELVRCLKGYDVSSFPAYRDQKFELFEDVAVWFTVHASIDLAYFQFRCDVPEVSHDWVGVKFGKHGGTSITPGLTMASYVHQRTFFALGDCLRQRKSPRTLEAPTGDESR